ncbi:flagellar basal-body rod protein FlgG [Billgrantia ethanolica]|uniref:Flagellar basal-body rod protein FlgG n=1 Tax=Billgrantia ethanolica TaxID=2733486 RepID=A0ABS9A194_9GAMM|nr:flagellar basal-body rod protein FlgG [Halomonas ethanolica]MCE8002380.1 flagellar basal-body rod protein FlgG [Halomonas ethanolica]
MIKSLWTAKTGLESQQVKLDVISNNLANVSTNGFKRSRAVFEDLLYQNLRQPGAQNDVQNRLPSGMQVGTGVRPVATERLHTQGGLEQTGNSRDLAINGNGFFQVLMPDGSTAYTRDGSFQLNENGQMVTANGYPLEPAIIIPDNALSISIGEDGVVSVTQPGVSQALEVGQITISTFVNATGLESMGGNLYQETTASGPRNETMPGMNGAGRLFQGYVETSNVNVVEEMVSMIQTQRAYEINSRAVQTSDEMLARLSQL